MIMGFIVEARVLVLTIVIISLTGIVGGAEPVPMFVFGDSYFDTGNHNKSDIPWKIPYGRTWPGRPSGRYSDGHVLIDLIGQFLGGSSPLPYVFLEKYSNPHELLKYGVNFAVGGSGVLESNSAYNFGVQVDQLNITLQNYSQNLPAPLEQILALVSFGGNDYSHFLENNGSIEDLPGFVVHVVNELTRNIERLHRLGLRNFAVTNLGNLGCLPLETSSVGYRHCIKEVDPLITFHNRLLTEKVNTTLGNLDGADFFIMELLQASLFVISKPYLFGFKHKLRPCCVPTSKDARCGNVDEHGQPLYTVCSNPATHLFWDNAHPTHAGWTAIGSLLINETEVTQSWYGPRSLASWLNARLSSYNLIS